MLQDEPSLHRSILAPPTPAATEEQDSRGKPKWSIAQSMKAWAGYKLKTVPRQQHHLQLPATSQTDGLPGSQTAHSGQNASSLNQPADKGRGVQLAKNISGDGIKEGRCGSDNSFSSETTAGGSWSSFPTHVLSPIASSAVPPVDLAAEGRLDLPENVATGSIDQALKGSRSAVVAASATQSGQKAGHDGGKLLGSRAKSAQGSSRTKHSASSAVHAATAVSPDKPPASPGESRAVEGTRGRRGTLKVDGNKVAPVPTGILKPYQPRKHRRDLGFSFKRIESPLAPQRVSRFGDVGSGQKVSFGKELHTIVYHYEQVDVPSEATPWMDVGALASLLFGSGGKASHPKSAEKQASSAKSAALTDSSFSVPVEYCEQIMIPLPRLESFVQEEKSKDPEDLSLEDLRNSFARTRLQPAVLTGAQKSASFTPSPSRRLGQSTPVKSSSAKPVSLTSRASPIPPLSVSKGGKRRSHTDFVMGHRAF